MSFPKHEWLRAVARDRGLDDSYARVAMDLSTSTSVDDGTFCVRQKTIAERMGRDVRSVKRAYAALKSAGYIERVAEGKRGRGYLSGDTWRLKFPQVKSGDASGTTSISGDAGGTEVVTPVAISGDDSSPEVGTTQAADSPPTSDDGDPVVLYEGLTEGFNAGAAEPEAVVDAEVVPTERGQERGRSDPVAVSASRLVSDIVPRNMPSAVKTGLRLAASQLIVGDGLPSDVVAESIRRWLTRPGLGVPMLAHIASDVLREGTAGPPRSKQRDWAEFAIRIREIEREYLERHPDGVGLDQHLAAVVAQESGSGATSKARTVAQWAREAREAEQRADEAERRERDAQPKEIEP